MSISKINISQSIKGDFEKEKLQFREILSQFETNFRNVQLTKRPNFRISNFVIDQI